MALFFSNIKANLVFFKNSLLIFAVIFTLSACGDQPITRSSTHQQNKHKAYEKLIDSKSLINLKHFDHLFSEIKPDDKKMAIIRIYSEYPNYSFAIEPEEGFACVDDVARAIVMLSEQIKTYQDDELLKKLKLLVEFVLYMQNENGYFNNFIWHDLTINTHYKTSIAELNWWSFRALWSLQVAKELVINDVKLSKRIASAINKVVGNIKVDLQVSSLTTELVNTVELPTWLPNQYAADQAALAIIALLPYYQDSADAEVLLIINKLAKGVMLMQKGDEKHYPYGMFLSWKNQWHAWGNSQAYALLLAGQQLNKSEYIQSALLEINNFYPYLLKEGFVESITIERNMAVYVEKDRQSFPQISYGLRPMVYAVAEAFKVTQNKKYFNLLIELKSWLLTNNDAGKIIYDQYSGRGYDAIRSTTKINLNSGAESTIEALLILQK
ncbi:MAG: hypothetical protein OCD00_16265 [Colwellia sp.]